MGFNKEKSDKLRKFTQFQFYYFKKVTGIELSGITADELLDYIGDQVEANYYEDKPTKEVENDVTKAVVDKAYPLLEETLKKAPRKYNDTEFYSIMDTFIYVMGTINSAYRREHDLGFTMNEEAVYSGITKDKMINLYEQATATKKSDYEEYMDEFSKLKKNRSKTLVDELNNRVNNCKTTEGIHDVGVVYKALKEKQKRNSFWTNWFTKKGYQERAALKACEERMYSRFPLQFSTGSETGNRLVKAGEELKQGLKTFEDQKVQKLGEFTTHANPYAKTFTRVKELEEGQVDQYFETLLDHTKVEVFNDGQLVDAEEAEDFELGNERPTFEKNEVSIDEPELTNN